MVTTAVIMAAGLGSRFGSQTEDKPKGFIKVGGIPMVERSIRVLKECGINRIIIGTGYLRECYDALARQDSTIECVFSPRYEETNSMFTLYNCKDVIGLDDFVLLESDLVFEKKAISSLIDCDEPDIMLITPVNKFQDQYYVEYNDNHILTNCSIEKNDLDAKGELVGIHKISNPFFLKMCKAYSEILAEKPKLGYEYELLYMSQNISPVYVLNLHDLLWYEIDDAQDLNYAEENIIPNL